MWRRKRELRAEVTHFSSAKARKQESRLYPSKEPVPVWFCSRPGPSRANLSRFWQQAVGGALGAEPVWVSGGGVFRRRCCPQNVLALFYFPPFNSFTESSSPSLQSLLWKRGFPPPSPALFPIYRAGLTGVCSSQAVIREAWPGRLK